MLGHWNNIIASLVQGGNFKLDHGKPVVEILSEFACCHQGGQIAVGSRYDAGLNSMFFGSANPLVLAGV